MTILDCFFSNSRSAIYSSKSVTSIQEGASLNKRVKELFQEIKNKKDTASIAAIKAECLKAKEEKKAYYRASLPGKLAELIQKLHAFLWNSPLSRADKLIKKCDELLKEAFPLPKGWTLDKVRKAIGKKSQPGALSVVTANGHSYLFHQGSQLDQGAKKIVYKAYDLDTNKIVALAISKEASMAELMEKDYEFLKMMQLQGDAARFLKPLDYFTLSNQSYLITEYHAKGTLKDHLDTLSDSEKRHIIRSLNASLTALHQKGILHRDIKPVNVLLSDQHEPILFDFDGACKMDDRDARKVTVNSSYYLSPKLQKAESDVESSEEEYTANIQNANDSSADLWSLGLVGFELLYGRAKPPKTRSDIEAFFQGKSSDPEAQLIKTNLLQGI